MGRGQAVTDGLREKVSMAEYLAIDAVSSHDLRTASRSMAHYHYRLTHPDGDTKAMQIGRALHWAILEPELFSVRVVVSQYENYRTNEAKLWRDTEEGKGNVVVSKDEHDELCQMRQSVREHPRFTEVFAAEAYEVTALSRHTATGLLRKARFDWIPKGNFLADIKTTVDASPDGFPKQAWNLGYFHQLAYYRGIWNALHPDDQRKECLVMAIEKEPPFLCCVHAIPTDALDVAQKQNNALLYRIAECQRAKRWPGYPDTIEYMSLPNWIQSAIDAQV